MRIIRRHLLGEWTAWFLGSLIFLLGTIFLFVLVEEPDQIFLGEQQYILDFIRWAFEYLPWLLPLCCLLSSLFTLAFIQKRGEWAAIQSNGISALQSLGGVVLAGLLLSCICGWLAGYEFPNVKNQSSYKAKALKMRIGKDRVWYFREFNSSSMKGSKVQLFCYGNKGEDLMRIRAEVASWSSESGWSFVNGRLLGFHSPFGLPVLSKNGHTLSWEKMDIKETGSIIPPSKSPGFNKSFDFLYTSEINDDPRPHLYLLEKPSSLSLSDLNRVLQDFPDSKDPQLAPYRLRKAHLWLTGPACMIGLFVGLALGRSQFSSSPGKIAGIALIGSIAFYSARTLFDSLGEQMFLLPELAAAMPYGLTLLFLVITWLWNRRV